MEPEAWKAVGYTIGVILIGIGSAFSAHRMQKVIRAAPVWDNGEKLGVRDAVRRLVAERDSVSERFVTLEVKVDRLSERIEHQDNRLAAIERAIRELRSA